MGFALTDRLLEAKTLQAPVRKASFAHARPAVNLLQFPRDLGAHTEFQTEWWYVTGFTLRGEETDLGFQLTFFRSRVASTQSSTSKLAARHLVFAHAAVSDVRNKVLHSDQRIARWSGLPKGLNPADQAWARLDDTGVALQDWSLARQGDGRLRAQVQAKAFALDVSFAETQALLLQGEGGTSRKGPSPQHFSHYYSLPQLRVQGEIRLQGRSFNAGAGSLAWLDHEWSDALLPPGAVGWDWIGINMLDGSALTAFQLRDKAGRAVWDGGSFRAGSTLYNFTRGEAAFQPTHWWQSPRSQARYPVQWLVRTPADFYTVKAVFEAQELDSRNSTGAIYWEGLCEVFNSQQRLAGRGYLEMTGYASPLRL
jgi:predicted secreted hydrolase